MQFIANGPDIPDELLQAHEEGRLVFFCGAGISYPAGLQGFDWLVKKIYDLNGASPFDSEIELEAFKREEFDATLYLLERRLPGQRLAVRRALTQALKPKLGVKGSTDTHTALLRLARNREGALRLVTTNFDRIFHVAARRTKQKFDAYSAPTLPIPKNSRWNGLVYLHGLVPEQPDDTALNQLVVTSGDFGLAYLTERWAARFVSELLRNYVVCFVGYSIDDPVLRYMMDALAVDRMLGEVTPQAWALGGCEEGKEHSETIKWKAKGVTPILYNNSDKHSALHRTLHAWAETYRDGVQGKEAIVVKHALTRPQESTQQDDFVGRMLWALSDKSGLPAKQFANFNPAPSLDWLLEPFANERFGHSDLHRFGVSPHDQVNNKLRFSLIRRPAPHYRAPPMLLVSGGNTGSQWDEVMRHLAHWLVRHLDDPRLIIWIAKQGGQLNDHLKLMIELRLDHFASLEQKGRTAELDEIRLQSPKAIPSPLMRTFWLLLLTGRVKSQWNKPDLFRWEERLKREGLTTTLRLELRELLAPRVLLEKPFRLSDDDTNGAEEPRSEQLVNWELALTSDNVNSTLRGLSGEYWAETLPKLLDDFQQLLRDALDLQRELGGADDFHDRSHWDLPSISDHRQNRGFRDWVCLIELLRDAWVAIHKNDLERSSKIAQKWFELPYPTFKRLALFAASQDGCISSKQWVDWLLADESWWLWSPGTRREVCRLFVLQAKYLAKSDQKRLEAAISIGPPRRYLENIEEARWHDLKKRSIWLHLAKLNSTSLPLSKAAAAQLEKISKIYPKWKLATNESDEFSSWLSETGDADFDSLREVDAAPRKCQELVQWLTKQQPEHRLFYEDTWRQVCRKHLLNCLCAFAELAQREIWPSTRWREALQVWSEDRMILRSWRYGAQLVHMMPDELIHEIANSVSWWLEVVSKVTNANEDHLMGMCRRILALPLESESGYRVSHKGVQLVDPVGAAINHSIGHVTQTLINIWFKRNLNDNELIAEDLKSIFTDLCNKKISRFKHARVLLASNVIALYRVDRQWTEQHLLPLFNWSDPVEAKAAWEGFLWSPRLYQPLLRALKSQFLDSANHYDDLGNHRRQFVTFLTYAALGPTEEFSVKEFRSAMGALPLEGLEESAQALYQALEGAADQREDYWKNRIQPFWQQIWPKSLELATPRIAVSLTRLAIAARGEFPAALAAVIDWLKPIEHPDHVVHLLHESGLCSKYPTDALKLLCAVIDDQRWGPEKLGKCLDQLIQAEPRLVQEPCFLSLRDFDKRRRT
jgi:hypothetical protein